MNVWQFLDRHPGLPLAVLFTILGCFLLAVAATHDVARRTKPACPPCPEEACATVARLE